MCDIHINVENGTAVLYERVSLWDCHTCGYRTTSFTDLGSHIGQMHQRLTTQDEGYAGPALRRIVVRGETSLG